MSLSMDVEETPLTASRGRFLADEPARIRQIFGTHRRSSTRFLISGSGYAYDYHKRPVAQKAIFWITPLGSSGGVCE